MANRQDGPHAHCNVFHPSYKWVFVPDLGDNAIHQYGWDNGRLTHQTYIQLPPKDGPRHFVFHPTLPVAYSGCELGSRLQVRSVAQQGVQLSRAACLSTVPPVSLAVTAVRSNSSSHGSITVSFFLATALGDLATLSMLFAYMLCCRC